MTASVVARGGLNTGTPAASLEGLCGQTVVAATRNYSYLAVVGTLTVLFVAGDDATPPKGTGITTLPKCTRCSRTTRTWK